MKHSFVAIQNILVAQIVSFSFFKKDSLDLIRLGTSYGGWFLPENILRAADKKRVLVSGGLGHDVSFDKILLKNGFEIIGLDPLSECCEFAINELGIQILFQSSKKDYGQVLVTKIFFHLKIRRMILGRLLIHNPPFFRKPRHSR